MKRKTLLLMLLMALIAPWTAKAQETIWSETFENYSGSGETALSSDWATPAMYGTKPCVHLSDSWAAAHGTRSIECRTNTSTTIMFVLPQFNKNLNTLTVKFNAVGHDHGRGQLGYVTNASNANTFTSLTDISQPVTVNGSSGGYSEYSYDLATLNAPANSSYRLAIKYWFVSGSVSEDSWYFDDFSVTYTEPSGGDSDCEDFNSTNGTSSYSTGGTLPSGWHRIYGGTTETGGTVYNASATSPANMPHVVTTSATTPGAPNSSNYICFYSNSDNSTYSYAIMPPVESGAVSHLSFKYKFESTSNGTLTYGAISGTDASTYTVLGTISSPSSNPGTIDVDLNTSQTRGKRIAFRWYKSGTWYTCGIDDVCIETTTIIPYEIYTPADWNDFCAAVNSGHSYSSETVTLMNDITTAVTTMAGETTGESTYNYAFKGTFDGQGHTLTVNLTSGTLSGSWYYTAPFRVIDGATIKNLKTTGTVTQNSGKGAAGLAGYTAGTCTITNCVSNVTINSLTDGDGTHGGFFSEIRGTTTMNNCAFTGSITGSKTNYCGGFVGWKSGTATFNNCVFAPTAITFDYATGNSANFSRNGGTFYNCYYTQTCGTGWTQGKLMHSITGASGITVTNAGSATSYTPETSTIVGYGTGIKFNNILYAGSGDNVSLTLSGGDNYMADHGTLTSSGSSYTLQMADYDTYIFVPNTVSVSANPSNGGTVSGGGQFANGASATVSAMTTGTYCFVNWTENGTVVSTDLNYTFNVTGDCNLVANFVSFDTDITVSGNTTIACGSTTTLTASGLNGVAYNWYSDAACTQLVQENSATLTTPALTENTTYYVKAVGGTSYMKQETTFSYKGYEQTYSIPSGTTAVKLEVWGAEGGGQRTSGNTNSGYGGKGGYSVGTFPSPSGTLYVYVGGAGSSSDSGTASGGYNGGGSGCGSSNTEPGNGGGGATHIAKSSGLLTSFSSNYSTQLLIVAGGGGGGGEDGSDKGGAGGGTSGETGQNSSTAQTGVCDGGTQTTPGQNAGFGYGASTNLGDGGGGGGGFYGGGSKTSTSSGTDTYGGGGGSGYLNTALAESQTIAGNASMPNPNGGTMTGREGDGYARITAYVTEECESAAVAVNVTVTQPAAPTDLAYSNVTTNSATVSWSGNASSYSYSIDGTNWTTTSNTTANLTGLTMGTPYTFQVKVVDGDCESEVASVSFTTQSIIVTTAAPVSSTTTATLGGSWSGGSASAYGVEYSTDQDFTSDVHQVVVTTVGDTGYSVEVTGLTPETTYYVRAYVTTGGTIYGQVLSFTTCAYISVTSQVSPSNSGTVTFAPEGEPNVGPSTSTNTVTIGTGTSYMPYYPFWSNTTYSVTEMIYTKDEINTSGTINKISFHCFTTASSGLSRNITVILKHTNRSSFTGLEWEQLPASASFTGTVTPAAGEWTTIELQTPFEYNGTDNLLVSIYDNTKSGVDWYYTVTPANTCTKYANQDAITDLTGITPNNNSGTTPVNTRPNIKLEIALEGTQVHWYGCGDTPTLTATATPGYYFLNWTDENNTVVSTDAAYTLDPLSTNRTLTANFIDYKRFTNDSGDGEWSTAENWKPVGAPDENENVAILANVIVPNGYVAKAKNISVSDGTITIADGGQLWHSNESVTMTVEKSITGYESGNSHTNIGYNLFSTPFENLPLSAYNGLVTNNEGGHFDWYSFNYANVEGGELLEWINEASNATTVVFLKGYIYANQDNTTITVSGTSKPSADPITGNDLAYTPNGTYRFNGWNLVGNPFVCNAYAYGVSGTTLSQLNYYKLNHNAGGYDEFIADDDRTPIAPMSALLVKATTSGQRVKYYREAQSIVSKGILNMSVRRANFRGTLDLARIRFGEGEGLPKFQLDPSHTKLYVPTDEADYAVVYADPVGEMPVNFKAEHNGQYTLSFSAEEVDFSYLHLIDNMTGADVDLLETPYYTFNAKTTDYESRFKVVFATGEAGNDDNFAFYSNGAWVIANDGAATLQVVDVTGRVLSSERISGATTKAINAASGIYMLRLINGDNVKVQKIVVR